MSVALYVLIGVVLAVIVVLADAIIFKFSEAPENRSIVTSWVLGILLAWPIMILGAVSVAVVMGILIGVEALVDWVYGEFE